MMPLFKVEAVSVETGEVIYASRHLCVHHQGVTVIEIMPGTAELVAQAGYPWGEVRYVTRPDGFGDCAWCMKYPQLYPQSPQRRPARPTFISFSL